MLDGAGGADTSAGVVLGIERSICGRRWRLRDGYVGSGEAIAERLGLPDMVGQLLARRGVDLEHAPSFLAPRLRDQLPDPSHLQDMEAAVARLVRAVRDGETIGIFGDYDVDGATSAALLTRFFAAAGTRTRIYVPDRLREGYGPNTPALLRLLNEGVRVIVTVDCGTTAHLPLTDAAAAGLDVIVVDHHVAEPLLPRAAAIVNPNRLDETSPHGALAAVGVAFLLVVAINRELRRSGWYDGARAEPDLLQWLDLVALGTVCDVVPLTGLNRAFVAQGIKVARRQSNPGLAALAAVAGIGEPIDAYHLGFVLGPRVNAGGRVGAAEFGARLLATDDPTIAAELAARLDQYNRERRDIEACTLEAAIATVEGSLDKGPGDKGPGDKGPGDKGPGDKGPGDKGPGDEGPEDKDPGQSPVLVFAAAENWHPGVIGIVAARLKERYDRPACVVALCDGIGRGSGRSVVGLPLGPAVIAARQAGLLINGGGHAMAAGFTVAAEKLDALQAFLIERLGDGIENERLVPELPIDGMLSVAAAQRELIDHIAMLAPFGAANPEPRFVFSGVRVVHAEAVGSSHLRCTLADPLGDARLRGIAFRAAGTPLGQFLCGTRGLAIHIAGHLRRDNWHGGDAVQLAIDDAAPATTI